MEAIDQQVINENREIYVKLQSELHKATTEIMLATAWFTDEDLFNILMGKLDQDVHIEVIIADNQENEKLDFNLLSLKGANVYKIKSSGYGIMNQKFCVIDRRIALHGSYNWTVNAKKNNHESIISTNHQGTIDSLIENFNSLKIAEQSSFINDPTASQIEKPKGMSVESQTKPSAIFEKVLDSMIAAEVGSFDRKILREHGFERCSANNGDHQVLHKAFDTLYSVFINDIDVIDDKKKRLIAKIEEYRIKTQDNLSKECELQINFLERENSLTQTNLKSKRTNLEMEMEVGNKSINDVKANKIPIIEQRNIELDQQVKNAEREHIRPPIKWFELIPTIILTTALFAYLLIFYSSAAYILLFSIEDAKLLIAQGIPVPPAQIFNPEAITKAWNKNGTAPFFILLFVFIPLTFVMADRFLTGKWAKWWPYLSFVFGIIIMDGAISYKVTEAIYQYEYIIGNKNILWEPRMAFIDTNFYLVFVFGAFGLLLFKLAFRKLMKTFEDRSPDTLVLKKQLLIKHLKEEIGVNIEKILVLKESIIYLEKNAIQWKAKINQINSDLSDLPKILNQQIQKKQSQLLKDAETIDKIAAIYTIHIQSDNLPISVDALKDRINVFLEGWNDFLHQEYAVTKATRKTSQAAEVAATWQAEKLAVSKIDKRVKHNQDV